MGICVCAGANLTCPFGTAPATLIVNSQMTVMTQNPTATIMDHKPMANVPTFGMCNSVANPATKRPPPVVFTPAPCVPNTASPWTPGSPTVMIAGIPALTKASILSCAWGGVITITNPGQVKTMAP